METYKVRYGLLWWCILITQLQCSCSSSCQQGQYRIYCLNYCHYGYNYNCVNTDLTLLNRGNTLEIKCTNCTINHETPFYLFKNLWGLEIIKSYLPNITIGLFNNVDSLQNLTLTSNNISFIWDHSFTALPNLKHLNLSFNSISTIRLADISAQSKITTLDLSFNLIKEATFPKTVNLLHLTQNELAVTNKTFSGLCNLTFLDISYNELTSIPDHAFQDLIHLRFLNLSGNSLVSLDYGSLSDLSQLNVLDVSFNYINTIPEYIFHDVNQLKELYINNNNISEINIKRIRENLPYLHTISIHDNEWSCEELSNTIRTLSHTKTTITSGNCRKLPRILNICCVKENIQQIYSQDSIDTTNNVLHMLNNFFNKDFVNSKFYNFFSKDYKQQNFWRYFDDDFKRTNLFRFFDTGFSQSRFYEYFNRDYFNATFQSRIIDKIDGISSNEKSVNVTELKDTLKGMFNELFYTINSTSNSIETVPEKLGSERVIQADYSFKDILLGITSIIIVLMGLYIVLIKCKPKKIALNKLKLYQMFRSKTSNVNENDVEIL